MKTSEALKELGEITSFSLSCSDKKTWRVNISGPLRIPQTLRDLITTPWHNTPKEAVESVLLNLRCWAEFEKCWDIYDRTNAFIEVAEHSGHPSIDIKAVKHYRDAAKSRAKSLLLPNGVSTFKFFIETGGRDPFDG